MYTCTNIHVYVYNVHIHIHMLICTFVTWYPQGKSEQQILVLIFYFPLPEPFFIKNSETHIPEKY